MQIVLDPGARSLDLCYWEDVIDHLIVSKDFILKNYGEIDLFTAVQTLGGGKISHAAITLGSGGLLYYDGSAAQFIPAKKVDSIDSTGAGDIFHGAYIWALTQKKGFKDALEFATAAAGYSTLFTGVFHPEINAENVNNHFK